MPYEQEYSHWVPIAKAIPGEVRVILGAPRAIFLKNALQIAQRFDEFWKPADPELPRFAPRDESDPNKKPRVPKEISDEIRSLYKAVRKADHECLMIPNPKRAQGIVDKVLDCSDELTTVLTYVLDDGIQDEDDERFEQIKKTFPKGEVNMAVLAERLFHLVAFAYTQRPKLELLAEEGDFDLNVLSEGLLLSEQLAMIPSGPVTSSPERQAALDLRDRLLRLILDRVEIIQKEAALKYRDHPKIQKLFQDDYQRRRNLLAQKRKAREEQKLRDQQIQEELERKRERIKAQLKEEMFIESIRKELEEEAARNAKK